MWERYDSFWFPGSWGFTFYFTPVPGSGMCRHFFTCSMSLYTMPVMEEFGGSRCFWWSFSALQSSRSGGVSVSSSHLLQCMQYGLHSVCVFIAVLSAARRLCTGLCDLRFFIPEFPCCARIKFRWEVVAERNWKLLCGFKIWVKLEIHYFSV